MVYEPKLIELSKPELIELIRELSDQLTKAHLENVRLLQSKMELRRNFTFVRERPVGRAP